MTHSSDKDRAMNEEDIKKMTDKDILNLLIATTMINVVKEEGCDRVFGERLKTLLSKAADNLSKVDDLMTKLIDANDNLAMERSSNKRMRILIADLAGVLHGNPALYPPPLNDLVARVHKEVGL
jgi:hypothetical protein